MILLIDNYDSFVHNLARYFQRLGQTTHVVRNDDVDADGVRCIAPRAIVLSPGPCTPSEAGCSVELVRTLSGHIPILGVCLGHQAIATAFGGKVVRADEPMHGRSSLVTHDSRGVFQGVPNPLTAGRYHSLIADQASLPNCLRITAWTSGGAIMGLEHQTHLTIGLQFHPESALTDHGYLLLHNFLTMAGLSPERSPDTLSEFAVPKRPEVPLPTRPVTF